VSTYAVAVGLCLRLTEYIGDEEAASLDVLSRPLSISCTGAIKIINY
jgi:hypothetical protein